MAAARKAPNTWKRMKNGNFFQGCLPKKHKLRDTAGFRWAPYGQMRNIQVILDFCVQPSQVGEGGGGVPLCRSRLTWHPARHKHPERNSERETQIDWQILAVFFVARGHLGNGATSEELREDGGLARGQKKKKKQSWKHVTMPLRTSGWVQVQSSRPWFLWMLNTLWLEL